MSPGTGLQSKALWIHIILGSILYTTKTKYNNRTRPKHCCAIHVCSYLITLEMCQYGPNVINDFNTRASPWFIP